VPAGEVYARSRAQGTSWSYWWRDGTQPALQVQDPGTSFAILQGEDS